MRFANGLKSFANKFSTKILLKKKWQVLLYLLYRTKKTNIFRENYHRPFLNKTRCAHKLLQKGMIVLNLKETSQQLLNRQMKIYLKLPPLHQQLEPKSMQKKRYGTQKTEQLVGSIENRRILFLALNIFCCEFIL